MEERDPGIIISALSRQVTKDGVTVELCIYRLTDEAAWSLEVVSSGGVSFVWEDAFSSDDAANEEFLKTVAEEGMASFLCGDEDQGSPC